MVRFGLVGLLLAACSVDAPVGDGPEAVTEAPDPYTSEGTNWEEPIPAGDEDDQAPEQAQDDEPVDDALIHFDHQATTYWSVVGVAVDQDGDEGLMGMSGGGACVIFPDDGDLGDEEDVHDCEDLPLAYMDGGGVLVGGIGCDDVSVYDGNGRVLDIRVPGLVAADAMGDDFVAVQSTDAGCELVTRHLDEVLSVVQLDASICEIDTTGAPSIVTDDASGTTYIAAGDLWAVGGSDAVRLAEDAGNLVAFDAANGAVITAFRRSTELQAVTTAGDDLWSITTAAPIMRMHEVGPTGSVLAHLMNDPLDVGRFVVYGGADGAVWGESIAWPQVNDLDVSADGGTMVMSTENSRVYSYRIRLSD